MVLNNNFLNVPCFEYNKKFIAIVSMENKYNPRDFIKYTPTNNKNKKMKSVIFLVEFLNLYNEKGITKIIKKAKPFFPASVGNSSVGAM
jgi:hypothetical protein